MCCTQKHKTTENSPLPIPYPLHIHPIQQQHSPHLTKHHSHLPAPSSLTHTEPSSLNGEHNRGEPAHPTQPHPTTVTRPGHPMRGSTINCTTPHSSPPPTQQRTSNNGRINGSKLLKLEIRPLIFTLIQCTIASPNTKLHSQFPALVIRHSHTLDWSHGYSVGKEGFPLPDSHIVQLV